ncbi:response regulator [Antarctobacter jejuensis]|uniref:response regulator n=1 Tax=Antarctobacter jejuensis TaxID=1439938 RepID=UPI003FD6222C
MQPQLRPNPADGPLEKTVTTCLVVDDDTFDRHMIKRCVTRDRPDLQMYECATLAEARAFLDQGKYDLILLDNRMPDGLGADFAEELHRDGRMRDSMICVVTNDDPRLLSDGITALSKDHLNTRTIWDMVSAFLEEREILRDTESARLVADFSDSLGKDMAPVLSRMLRTLRMVRARVSRRDPQKALDELDRLEEMLLAFSDMVDRDQRS